MKKLIIGFLVIIGLLNETEEALTSKICQKEGFFRDPSNCKKFYRCVDWSHEGTRFSIFLFDCPSGTTFDEVLQICNFPWKSPPCKNKPDSQQSGSAPTQDLLAKPPTFVVTTQSPSSTTASILKPTSVVASQMSQGGSRPGFMDQNQGLVPLSQLPSEIINAEETVRPVLLPLPFPGGIGLPPIQAGINQKPGFVMTQESNKPGSQHLVNPGDFVQTPSQQSTNLNSSVWNHPSLDNNHQSSMMNPVLIQDGFIIGSGSNFQMELQTKPSATTIPPSFETESNVPTVSTQSSTSLMIPTNPSIQDTIAVTNGISGDSQNAGSQGMLATNQTSGIQPGITIAPLNNSSGSGIKFEVMEGSIFECPAPGFYPHEDNCHDFYVCLEILPGVLLADQVYRCPKRYLFDDVTLRCQREHKVNCQKFSLEGPSSFAKETVLVVLEQFLEQFFNTPLNYQLRSP